MSMVILTIARAVSFSFLESSAKFSAGWPLGIFFTGSSVWQVLHWVPRALAQPCIISCTWSPVRVLGRTLRLVGAGAGGCACCSPPGDGGACATVVTANNARPRTEAAAAGRDREVIFKGENVLTGEIVSFTDGILR